MKEASSDEKLELAISYILIVGVIVSVLIETIGIVNYYYVNQNLNIIFEPSFALQGNDFFRYSETAIHALLLGSWTPLHILALGLVILMMTPYVRVVASVAYFGWIKNPKYLAITVFVLVILTASLLFH